MIKVEPYNEDYFERGEELGISGYTKYHWMPEMTIPLAHEMVTQLGIQKTDRILDFGCAKGFLVKALRLLHYEAFGVDASKYALSQAPKDVKKYLYQPATRVDWIISKDVLEHIEHEHLPELLKNLSAVGRNMFAIVPLGDGQKYIVPEYENDVTHIIRESLDWWACAFNTAGFRVARATTNMPHIKANWEHYIGGNGFFILRSRL